MEEQKKGFFELLDKKQSFVFGIVAGFLVLCTIGFFILLGVVLKGGVVKGGVAVNDKSDTAGTVTTDGSGNVAGPAEFSKCLDSGSMAAKVNAELSLGESLGVRGTPATFINGYLVSGALPYEALKQVVDALLAGKTPDFDFLKSDTGKVEQVKMPELADAIWQGNTKAKVTVVEFSDFECPYCQRFLPTINKLVADYKDKIKFTFQTFPLSFHPNAQKASEAFQCAKVQGKGWEMHDQLFALGEQQQLNVNSYKTAAVELGLE